MIHLILQVTSADGWGCVECGVANPFNPVTSECMPCPSNREVPGISIVHFLPFFSKKKLKKKHIEVMKARHNIHFRIDVSRKLFNGRFILQGRIQTKAHLLRED